MLCPGGEIHIAGWGRPDATALRAGFLLTQLLDGFETMTDYERAGCPTSFKRPDSCPLPRWRTSPPLLAVFG